MKFREIALKLYLFSVIISVCNKYRLAHSKTLLLENNVLVLVLGA